MPEGLARQAVRGVFSTGIGQVLRQVIQVAGSIALARLLAPDDFGVLGMAMFFIGIGQLFASFGIGSAIVQSRSDDRLVLSSCFWLNIAVAGALALFVALTSPWVADFYGRPDLAPVVAALASTLFISGLQVIPTSILYRDMKFADLAVAQVLGSLVGAIAAVGLAWGGAGVWSLVAQAILGNVVNLAICVRSARWRPSLTYSWTSAAPFVRFTAPLLGTSLLGYANRNTDSLIIGRFLGAGPLGIYAMAMQLMLFPLQQVSSVIVRVLFPTLVQIQDDIPRLRAAYLKAISTIAFVTFPMMGGLFAVADDFVLVVFGPKWIDLAPLLKVLAWTGMVQSVATTMGAIYLALGKPNIAFKVTLIGTPVVIAAFLIGLPWGIMGVAYAYTAATFSLFYYTALQAFGLIGLSIREFHRLMYRPFIVTIGMVVVVLLAVHGTTMLEPTFRLGMSIAVGISSYLLLTSLFNGEQLRTIVQLLRTASRAKGP